MHLAQHMSTEVSVTAKYLQSHLPAVKLSYSVHLHACKALLQTLLAILHLHTGINSCELQGNMCALAPGSLTVGFSG